MSQRPSIPDDEPDTGDERSDFEAQVSAVRASGMLARSRHLARLFDFLLACYRSGRLPKEIEVAVEGLGRAEGFDVTQDALARVYIHKLRRKLDEFYLQASQANSPRLLIPKGEYRLCLERTPLAVEDAPEEVISGRQGRLSGYPQAWAWGLGLLLAISLSLNVGLALLGDRSPEHRLRASQPWQALFADDRPVLIVVGDYYLFAEADRSDTVRRLVRDFSINSPIELANQLQIHPEMAGSQFDVGLSYLPTSVAHALARLAPILNGPRKKLWGVVTSSELIPENLRNSHIVFIGHLSSLGVLEELVFAHSGFRRGASYDELVDGATGKQYISDNGVPNPAKSSMSHLAYLSSFKGPSGNHIVVVAGFRDAGLRALGEVLDSEAGLAAFAGFQAAAGFEALYETTQLSLASTPARALVLREMPESLPQVPEK